MTDSSIWIRQAVIDDTATIAQFNIAMARETEGRELNPETTTAGVQAIFDNPDHGFYVVANVGEKIVGSLMITKEWSDWRNGVFWWIQSVYVNPDHRRRGIYKMLYQHVKRLAQDVSGVCGFRLYVEKDNDRAQQTYASLGMRPTDYLLYEEELIEQTEL